MRAISLNAQGAASFASGLTRSRWSPRTCIPPRRLEAVGFLDAFSYLSRASRRVLARHIMPTRVLFDPRAEQAAAARAPQILAKDKVPSFDHYLTDL